MERALKEKSSAWIKSIFRWSWQALEVEAYKEVGSSELNVAKS